MIDVATIAGKLTPAQISALCPNDNNFAEQHKGKAFSINIRTASVLHNLGLTETCTNLAHLTADGLAVREYLKGVQP
jgi:hypothetical protein